MNPSSIASSVSIQSANRKTKSEKEKKGDFDSSFLVSGSLSHSCQINTRLQIEQHKREEKITFTRCNQQEKKTRSKLSMLFFSSLSHLRLIDAKRTTHKSKNE
jgi:hypothetical protein